MNRKQFLLLIVALLILGGVGIALFWQDLGDYRASGAKIGAKLIPEIKVAEVARIELKDAKSRVTLVRQETGWVVQERNSYPADFKAISDLIIKLIDLKVVQAESIGESLWPRVELVEPGKGEGSGTQVELKDAAGKTLTNVIVGKTILKKDPGNPLPSAQNGVPAGRYIRIAGGGDKVVVVSDPLTLVEAQPGRWLDKRFFKVERLKTLAVSGEGMTWKIARGEEWEQWKFAGGGADLLHPQVAMTTANAIGNLTFKDVEMKAKPEDEGKPTLITAETFDNLTYVFKVAKRKSGDDYLVQVSVAGDPPVARPPEKNEKAQDTERRDKEFAESRKRLEARISIEKMLGNWSYVVEGKQLEPILKTRESLVARREAPDAKRVK
jgi:hypothetical protein